MNRKFWLGVLAVLFPVLLMAQGPTQTKWPNVLDGLPISHGDVSGVEVVHKFGRAVVGTSFTPIAVGGIYRTPQPAAATALRVKAGDANDTAAGTGAQEITLQGLSATGILQSVTVATNGTSAGTATTETFIRLFRAWVSKSGTYADQSNGSHAADIVIENSAGTEDWLTIDSAGFPRGQSEVAVYSVPKGKTAYISSIAVSVDSTKVADILLFKREGILTAASPYDAMRAIYSLNGIVDSIVLSPKTPLGPFPEGTDIGFMGEVSATTGEIDVDFEIILITN